MAVDPKETYQRAMDRRAEMAKRVYVVPKKSTAELQAEAEEVRASSAPEKARVMGPRDMFAGSGGNQVVKTFAPGEVKDAKVRTQSVEESETSADARGDAQVQARDAQELERPEGEEPQAGDSHRHERERPVKEAKEADAGARGEEYWVSRRYEAETKEALSELIPSDAKAVSYKRVWTAWALVRKG